MALNTPVVRNGRSVVPLSLTLLVVNALAERPRTPVQRPPAGSLTPPAGRPGDPPAARRVC